MPERRSSAVRLADVAEKAGVSLTTASFAMSGRPGVSEAVAERIRAIAAELGYVPNMQARSLASGASSTIGLVVHDIADPYFAELAASVVGAANDLGLMVQICQSSRQVDHELREVRTLVANRVRSIIIAGSGRTGTATQTATYEELKRYQATGGRVAMIGRHRVPFDAVTSENFEAGRQIGAHLASLGHRSVAVAAGPADLAAAEERLAGVLEALTEAGITATDTHVVHADFTHEGGERAAAQILAEHAGATAIIALNDAMAAGVLSTLRRSGVGVPTEMSVSGFDDVAVAADLGPGLTTIRFPLGEMGAAALRLALKPAAARPRRTTVPGTLMERGSTAHPRGGPLRTPQTEETYPPSTRMTEPVT